jgi:hypothetical protein
VFMTAVRHGFESPLVNSNKCLSHAPLGGVYANERGAKVGLLRRGIVPMGKGLHFH